MLYFALMTDDDYLKDIIIIYLSKRGESFKYTTMECTNFRNDFWRYDLIILDISQKNLAKKIRSSNMHSEICFLKDNQQNINNILEYHPFGFIEKPFQVEKIHRLIADVILHINSNQYHRRIRVVTAIGIITLNVDSILYFSYMHTVEGKHTTMVTVEGKFKMKQDATIKNLYKYYQKFNFEISHESFLVNLFNIKIIKGYDIRMINEDSLPFSKRRSAYFRKVYENLDIKRF